MFILKFPEEILKNKLLPYLSLIIIYIRENDKNNETIRAGGRDWIFLRWVNPILPWEPQRMLCTCALWESTGAREVGKEVLMAETVRSPFDYREPPTLDSDGDGSKPPPPRGWVSGASVRFVAVLGLLLSGDICEQKMPPDARAARVHVCLVIVRGLCSRAWFQRINAEKFKHWTWFMFCFWMQPACSVRARLPLLSPARI